VQDSPVRVSKVTREENVHISVIQGRASPSFHTAAGEDIGISCEDEVSLRPRHLTGSEGSKDVWLA